MFENIIITENKITIFNINNKLSPYLYIYIFIYNLVFVYYQL